MIEVTWNLIYFYFYIIFHISPKKRTNVKSMQYLELRKQFEDYLIFSLNDVRKADPSFHRQRLNEWIDKGYLRKVIKGYYVFSDAVINEPVLFLIANEIYSPSYVSLEMALSYYGLIPEGVYEVTSVSSKTTRILRSDIASFRYQHLKPGLLWGYRLVENNKRFFKIAEPEKAILDYLYLHPNVKTSDDFSGLRMNGDSFREHMDVEKLKRYAENFGKASLKRRVGVLLQSLEI